MRISLPAMTRGRNSYELLLYPLSREFAKEKDRVESRAGFLLLKEEQKRTHISKISYIHMICILIFLLGQHKREFISHVSIVIHHFAQTSFQQQ